MECSFCGSERLDITHVGQMHKVDPSFGPFDMARCRQCGSLSTVNPPSRERLATFYRDYHLHRPHWYNAASANGALDAQYASYALRIANALARPDADWVDVGSGHGEVANLLAQYRPASRGTAIDIGDRSESLLAGIANEARDLNAEGWGTGFGRQFDIVFSVAVWEHVLSPTAFAAECLSLVRPGGTLLLITPDYGSAAAKALGQRWPYFEPGEHISIPTKSGADACLRGAAKKLDLSNVSVRSSSLWVAYSVSYLFSVLGLRSVASVLPPRLAAPVPTGILIATANSVETK